MIIGGPLLFKQPVACQQMIQPTPTLVQEQQQQSQSLIHKGEISFGVLLGLCTGYFLKKIGKLFAFMVGLGFVSLQVKEKQQYALEQGILYYILFQYMSAKGYVTVHWDKISGSDRKIDVQSKWQTLVGLLTHNIQFKTTFMAGLYAGIRYGQDYSIEDLHLYLYKGWRLEYIIQYLTACVSSISFEHEGYSPFQLTMTR